FLKLKENDLIKQGDLDEHEKLVAALSQVDVVISTLAVPQHLEQFKIIKAMKGAGNIKRFVPSEFGNEVDRVSGLPPFEALLANKRRIRRATEEAGISYTYVSANSFAAYFVDYLLHPHENRDEVVVYGSGEAKAVLNYEEDVAAYTVKAATDPRVGNRVIVYRPPGNIVSQLDLISSWEKKTGRTLKKINMPEEEIVKLSETLPFPDSVPVAILHNIFIKGDQTSFELTANDLEASQLYPDHKYTSVDALLDTCLVNPPSPN
ncbi:isoeugenol synthase 1, partial [Quercus suber]